MADLFDFLLHLDAHLQEAAETQGPLVYGLIAGIVFCETGLIIFSVLPGDSLLFATGSLAAAKVLHPLPVLTLLPTAAFLGDQANFWLGRLLGRHICHGSRLPLVSAKNLERAEQFYSRYGAATIIFGRFIPVVRSIVPFAAAVIRMPYSRFVRYSLMGSAAWSLTFLLLGLFFGSIPFIKDNLWMVLAGVVVLSFLPALVQYMRFKKGGE